MFTLVRPGSANDSTHGTIPVKMELLAYHLVPLFKNAPKDPLNPHDVERTFVLIDKLLRSYIQGYSFQQQGTNNSMKPALVKDLLMDTMIVRGSAYPEQTMNEISEVQGHFEDWFTKRARISPRRAIEILLGILRAEEDLGNAWRFKLRDGSLQIEKKWKEAKKTKRSERTTEQKVLLEMAHSSEDARGFGYAQTLSSVPPDDVPVSRQKLSPEPTTEEWDGLIRLIGCTPESRNSIKHTVEMQRRPLFVLSGNRVLLCDLSNAVDQLWHAFEHIARLDQSFYSGAYQAHRGRWLEDRIAALVQRIFPPATIYKKLTYPDPDKGPNARTELDIAIHWPPFLVLIEAKAAQFRFESQLGDIGRLKSDIKANVADAFDQARRANRFIQSVPEAVFLESSTGRTLIARKAEIQRIYLTTVTLHSLAGIATRLSSIQGLGLFGDGEYPWAISLADLDLVTEFCPGPDVFLHFAERRLAIQKEEVHIRADEIDLFGAYLKTRLQANRIWQQEGKKRPDWVWLSGFQDPFDAVMASRRGAYPNPPPIRLEIPQKVEGLLQELRTREDDKDARWIAFSLLSLSDRALDILAAMFVDLRSQTFNTDVFRRGTYTEGDLAISIVATKTQPADALMRNTQSRTLLEKYRRRCTRSIGFGVMTSDLSKPFECSVWADRPWVQDLEMERLIENEPAPVPSPGSKIPGRNDPCLCGSTKKFKKCCLPKMEVARRS